MKRDLSLKRKSEARQKRAKTKGARGLPVPRLARKKRIVGLKIGASQIAAATVVNNGVPRLVQVAREDLDRGVVVGGELRDPEALAAALKRFFRKHKLPKRNVRLGVATNRIGVRTFDLPAIADPRQLHNAVRFRAQEALPVPLDQAVLDYHVLDGNGDGPGSRRVLLAVTYRDLVERYFAACRDAGIRLAGIDLEAFALVRSLADPRRVPQTGNAAFVAIAVGHDRSTLAVSNGRVCEFTRVIEWGGAKIDAELARALEVPPPVAERIKHQVSLDERQATEGVPEKVAAVAHDAIRREVHSFARELVSSLQFYQEQPGSLGIAEVVLAGGTAHLSGFAEELQRLLSVDVRMGDPLARVAVGKKVISEEQPGSLAVAIGLGIED